MKRACTSLFAIAAAAAPARADAPRALPAGGYEVHATAAVDLAGGPGTMSVGERIDLGVGRAFGHGRVRPQIGLGATVGRGDLFVRDARALDGSLDVQLLTWGPEAQAGLRFVDGGMIDTRLFASVALLDVRLDPRLTYDTVPGVSGASPVGVRASLGGNWADRIAHRRESRCHRKADCELEDVLAPMRFLAPQQAAFVYERDGGSGRYGLSLGWGI